MCSNKCYDTLQNINSCYVLRLVLYVLYEKTVGVLNSMGNNEVTNQRKKHVAITTNKCTQLFHEIKTSALKNIKLIK